MLNWLNVLGIAVGLSMDALAVSIAAGLKVRRVTRRHVFRAGWHFGLFQFLMPVLGYFAGRPLAGRISGWDHWVAFGLLTIIAAKMLIESLTGEPGVRQVEDPTRGWSLTLLAVATSIDALAVGVTLAVQDVAIWTPAAVIGVVTAVLSGLGIYFAGRLGSRWEHRAEWIGAAVLFAVGLKILLGHRLGG
jgi:manganese efflux pump family protein